MPQLTPDQDRVIRGRIEDVLDSQGLDSSPHSIDLVMGRLIEDPGRGIDVTGIPQAATGMLARAGDLLRDVGAGAFSLTQPVAWAGGFQPQLQAARERWGEGYTPAHQAGQEALSGAEGVGGVLGAFGQNPMQVPGMVAQSALPMLAGGVVGRGMLAAFPRMNPMWAAGAGEGAVGGFLGASDLPEDTPLMNRLMTGAATGAATALIGRAGAAAAQRVGRRLGRPRPAAGRQQAPGQQAPGALDPDAVLLGMGLPPGAGVMLRAAGVPIEALEEISQEAVQQILANVSQGLPWAQGVPEAATMGGVLGAGMASAFSLLPGAAQPGPVEPARIGERARGAMDQRRQRRAERQQQRAAEQPPAQPEVRRQEAPQTEEQAADDKATKGLIGAIEEKEQLHRDLMRAEPGTPEARDAEYRVARAAEMKDAVRRRAPRLQTALRGLRGRVGYTENQVGDEARAVARYVVARRAAERMRALGNESGALAIDALSDEELQQAWIDADTKAGGPERARLEDPAYQEQALVDRYGEPDVTGGYRHEIDTTPNHPAQIPEIATASPDEGGSGRLPGNNEVLPGHWAVVNANDVIPSHYQGGRAPENRYPRQMQERDYSYGSLADQRVQDHSAKPLLDLLVETNPSVDHGVPTILPSGAVLAGNERTMIAKGQYGRGGEAADEYRTAVLDKAIDLGMEVPAGVERPMLVRVLDPSPRYQDIGTLKYLNRMSDSQVQKGQTAEHVAATRQSSMASLTNLIANNIREDQSVGEFLDEIGAIELADALAKDRVFTKEDQLRLVKSNPGGGVRLTEEGLLQVEKLVRQRAIRSSAAYEAMPVSLRRKLDGAWHAIVAAEENSGLPFHEMLRDFGFYAGAAKAWGENQPKPVGLANAIGEFWKQPSHLGDQPEFLGQFGDWLMKTPVPRIRKAFTDLAQKNVYQMDLLGNTPTLDQLVREAFSPGETSKGDAYPGVTARWVWSWPAHLGSRFEWAKHEGREEAPGAPETPPAAPAAAAPQAAPEAAPAAPETPPAPPEPSMFDEPPVAAEPEAAPERTGARGAVGPRMDDLQGQIDEAEARGPVTPLIPAAAPPAAAAPETPPAAQPRTGARGAVGPRMEGEPPVNPMARQSRRKRGQKARPKSGRGAVASTPPRRPVGPPTGVEPDEQRIEQLSYENIRGFASITLDGMEIGSVRRSPDTETFSILLPDRMPYRGYGDNPKSQAALMKELHTPMGRQVSFRKTETGRTTGVYRGDVMVGLIGQDQDGVWRAWVAGMDRDANGMPSGYRGFRSFSDAREEARDMARAIKPAIPPERAREAEVWRAPRVGRPRTEMFPGRRPVEIEDVGFEDKNVEALAERIGVGIQFVPEAELVAGGMIDEGRHPHALIARVFFRGSTAGEFSHDDPDAIYINKDRWERETDPNERATVLAHELGHLTALRVIRRHLGLPVGKETPTEKQERKIAGLKEDIAAKRVGYGPTDETLGAFATKSLMGVGLEARDRDLEDAMKIVAEMYRPRHDLDKVYDSWMPDKKLAQEHVEDAARYNAYLDSPSEVGADFFATAVTTPGLIRELMPGVWDAFYENLPGDVRDAFNDVRREIARDLVRDANVVVTEGGEVFDALAEDLRQGAKDLQEMADDYDRGKRTGPRGAVGPPISEMRRAPELRNWSLGPTRERLVAAMRGAERRLSRIGERVGLRPYEPATEEQLQRVERPEPPDRPSPPGGLPAPAPPARTDARGAVGPRMDGRILPERAAAPGALREETRRTRGGRAADDVGFGEAEVRSLAESLGQNIVFRDDEEMEGAVGYVSSAVVRGYEGDDPDAIYINRKSWDALGSDERAQLVGHELGHSAVTRSVRRSMGLPVGAQTPGAREEAAAEAANPDVLLSIASVKAETASLMGLGDPQNKAILNGMYEISAMRRPRYEVEKWEKSGKLSAAQLDEIKAFNEYLNSLPETAADFFATAITDPETVRRVAPEAFRAFHENMPRDVRQRLQDIKADVTRRVMREADVEAMRGGREFAATESARVRDLLAPPPLTGAQKRQAGRAAARAAREIGAERRISRVGERVGLRPFAPATEERLARAARTPLPRRPGGISLMMMRRSPPPGTPPPAAAPQDEVDAGNPSPDVINDRIAGEEAADGPTPPTSGGVDVETKDGAPKLAGVPVDDAQIQGFDLRAMHELSKALGGIIRVANKREEARMKRGGKGAGRWAGMAVPKGLQIVVEPETFNDLDEDQQRKLVAHELGHISEMIGPDDPVPPGPVGRMMRLMGLVGRTMRRSRHLKTQQLLDQMKSIAHEWHPIPADADEAFKAYRNDPREIWADFYSAVLVNPAWVRQRAPAAWRAFHDNMPKKTRENYLSLREQLGTDEGKLERDVAWQRDLHRKQAAEVDKRAYETALDRRVRRNDTLRELEVKFVARGGPMRRLTIAAERRGDLDPEQNPFSTLAQGLDRSTLLADKLWTVPKTLNAAGIPEFELDDFLRNEQVVEGDAVFDYGSFQAASDVFLVEAGKGELTDGPDPRQFVRFVHRLNAGGFTPETSGRLLADQRKRLGPEKMAALEEAAGAVRAGLRDSLRRLQESEIVPKARDFSDPAARANAASWSLGAQEAAVLAMEANEKYVPRAVLDFGGSESVSGIPKERRGSVRDLDRMLSAAEEKIYRAHHASFLNDAKNQLVRFLESKGGDLAPVEVQAEWRGESEEGGKTIRGGWVMTGRAAQEQRGKGVLAVWQDHKQKFYAVEPWVAAGFARGDASRALEYLRNPNMFTRTMFLTVKPAWHVANAVRDFQRTWRNNPRYSKFLPTGLAQLTSDYVRYLPIAAQAARTSGARRGAADIGSRAAQRFIRAERAGVLPEQYRSDVIYGEHGERAFDKWRTADYLDKPISEQKADVRLASGAWNRLKKAGYWAFVAPMYVMEALPRIASYERALAEGGAVDETGRLSMKETRRIRAKIGSPPFEAALRGTNPFYSALFQFSTSTINGWTEDISTFIDPETRLGAIVKTSQLIGLASLGLVIRSGLAGGGEDEPDHPLHPTVMAYREEPSWDLGGTVMVPMPWAFDRERNRTVFFKFPIDHSMLPVTIGLAKAFKEVEAGSTAGEHVGPVLIASELAYGLATELNRAMPTVSASVDVAWDLGQTVQGKNPYDDFRERNWFGDREFDRLTYGERLLKYGVHIAPRQLGMPWLSEAFPKAIGRGDFLRAGVGRQERPIIDALTRRFITEGNYGQAETMRLAGERARVRARREELPPQTGPWGVEWAADNPNASPGALKRAAAAFARQVEPDRAKRARVERGAAREAFFRQTRNEPVEALQGVSWSSIDGGNEVLQTRMRALVRSGTISRPRLRRAVQDMYRAGVLGRTPARRDLLLDVIREGRAAR